MYFVQMHFLSQPLAPMATLIPGIINVTAMTTTFKSLDYITKYNIFTLV